MQTTELSASQEDYLETIYFLSRDEGRARPKDIARRMKVRAASVTGALKALAEKGLINYAPYALVTLTESGQEVAGRIAVKHEALLHFSEEFACTMEHTIPDHILKRFVGFAEYTEKCPNFNANWQENAEGYFCKAQGCETPRCTLCKLTEDQA
jgi:DtxR family Mn-dependent transcriptional regulator